MRINSLWKDAFRSEELGFKWLIDRDKETVAFLIHT